MTAVATIMNTTVAQPKTTTKDLHPQEAATTGEETPQKEEAHPLTTTATEENHQRDTTARETTLTIETATRKILELLTIAFQLTRPLRISDSRMFSAMKKLSRRDTARLQITESSTSVMPVPDPTKELIQ